MFEVAVIIIIRRLQAICGAGALGSSDFIVSEGLQGGTHVKAELTRFIAEEHLTKGVVVDISQLCRAVSQNSEDIRSSLWTGPSGLKCTIQITSSAVTVTVVNVPGFRTNSMQSLTSAIAKCLLESVLNEARPCEFIVSGTGSTPCWTFIKTVEKIPDALDSIAFENPATCDEIRRLAENTKSSVCIKLEGPPGTGKSTLAAAAANEFCLAMFTITKSAMTDDCLHAIAASVPPYSLLFIDDIDAFVCGGELDSRALIVDATRMHDKATSGLTLAGFLKFLDGNLFRKGPIVIVMASNHWRKFDSAVVREGRVHMDIAMKEFTVPMWMHRLSRVWPEEFRSLSVRDQTDMALELYKRVNPIPSVLNTVSRENFASVKSFVEHIVNTYTEPLWNCLFEEKRIHALWRVLGMDAFVGVEHIMDPSFLPYLNARSCGKRLDLSAVKSEASLTFVECLSFEYGSHPYSDCKSATKQHALSPLEVGDILRSRLGRDVGENCAVVLTGSFVERIDNALEHLEGVSPDIVRCVWENVGVNVACPRGDVTLEVALRRTLGRKGWERFKAANEKDCALFALPFGVAIASPTPQIMAALGYGELPKGEDNPLRTVLDSALPNSQISRRNNKPLGIGMVARRVARKFDVGVDVAANALFSNGICDIRGWTLLSCVQIMEAINLSTNLEAFIQACLDEKDTFLSLGFLWKL